MRSPKIIRVRSYHSAEVSQTQSVPFDFSKTASITGADIGCVSDVIFIKSMLHKVLLRGKFDRGKGCSNDKLGALLLKASSLSECSSES